MAGQGTGAADGHSGQRAGGGGKRARTRAMLLASAFEVIGREQGRLARIDDVILAAGISRGTFYNYFRGMADLFDALGADISHRFNNAVLACVATLASPNDRCAAAMRFYLDRARLDEAWGWAMVNLSSGGPIFGAETFHHATASIGEGIASGAFDVADEALGRDLMLGAVLAAMISILRGRRDAAYPAAVARRVLIALGADPEAAAIAAARPLPDPETWHAAHPDEAGPPAHAARPIAQMA